MSTDSCATCMYFEPRQAMRNAGACRRYPPQSNVLPQQTLQGPALGITCDFPVTKGTSWCGEHKPGPQIADTTAAQETRQ